MSIIIILLPLALIGGGIYLLNLENKKMKTEKTTNDIGSVKKTSDEKHNPAFHLFLYLVSFLSVGFLVSGIIISFFQAINKFVPDDLLDGDSSYFDNDAIKFGLSALIVTIPLYYGILFLLNKKLERKEIPESSLIRKTITYLALVAFSAMTIGSLVTLIYNYFDGELTTRFVLKTIVFLAVSLFFFGFYFWEVRRAEFGKGVFRGFFLASMVLAVASMILGFFVIDSPRVTRTKRVDNELIRKMRNAGSSVNSKFKGEDFIKSDLTRQQRRDQVIAEMAKSGQSLEAIEAFVDKYYSDEEINSLPTAKEMQGIIDREVTYKPGEDSNYELCGTFKGKDLAGGDNWNTNREKWAHPAGEHCFTFDAEMDSYNIYPIRVKSE